MALAMSRDATHWSPALRFEYISGPLGCPAGTVEYTTCDNQLWRTFAQQLGVASGATGSQCSSGPAALLDAPPLDGAPPRRSGGCCDAGDPGSMLGLAIGALWLVRARRPRITRR
jgi:hypothetical protein